MQVAIKKIFTNNINTMYGAKIKYDIYVDVNGQEFKFSSWQGNWNKDWTMGTMIDLPESNDSRWQKKDYNGKTYMTLKAPPEASRGYVGGSTPQPQQAPTQGLDPNNAFGSRMTEAEQQIVLMKKDIEKLQTEMADFKFKKMEEEIAKDKDDDIPIVSGDDMPLEDIPF
jgi:hypothetical protein